MGGVGAGGWRPGAGKVVVHDSPRRGAALVVGVACGLVVVVAWWLGVGVAAVGVAVVALVVAALAYGWARAGEVPVAFVDREGIQYVGGPGVSGPRPFEVAWPEVEKIQVWRPARGLSGRVVLHRRAGEEWVFGYVGPWWQLRQALEEVAPSSVRVGGTPLSMRWLPLVVLVVVAGSVLLALAAR